MIVSASSIMESVWLPALGVLLAVAVVAVWRLWTPPRSRGGGLATDRPPVPVEAGGELADLDVGREIRGVLQRLEHRGRDNGVRFSIAVEPLLTVRADPRAVRQALLDLVEHAVGRSPNGSVLVSAGRLGGGVRVAVSDDGRFGDATTARAALRGTSELVALQGGNLEIDCRPDEGLTVAMRLPGEQTCKQGGVVLAHASSGNVSSPACHAAEAA